MQSHVLNMLITSLILGGCFHVFYYNKKYHRWHHHFWVYFSILFVGGVGFAWFMYLTEAKGYYP